MRFVAVLEPPQLKGGALAQLSRLLAPPQPITATLEVALTPSGVPIRTVLTAHISELTNSTVIEVPAVNFPLVIEAPPAAQTITARQLVAHEKRASKHAHK
jgi:hypothetical protein